MMSIHKFAGFVVLLSTVIVFHGTAYAGCAAGLPCVTPLTPDPNLLDGVIPQNQGGAPNASKIDPSGNRSCDADFMNQIYAKAFIEAEREVIVANTNIKKPDSVLEYSCFDARAENVGNVLGPGTVLPGLIQVLTRDVLVQYAGRNFGHDFLGGAVPALPGVCDAMFSLNHVSKCDDFGLDAPFMTFEAYFSTPALTAIDPRTLPVACPSGHGITQDIVNVANNVGRAYAAIDTLDLLLPIQNPEAGACENDIPIPTGVIAAHVENDIDLAGNPVQVVSYTYEDKVCSNPGCYFNNQGNSNGGDDRCVP